MAPREALHSSALQISNRFAILDLLDDDKEEPFPTAPTGSIPKKSEPITTVPTNFSWRSYDYGTFTSRVNPSSPWAPKRQEHDQGRFENKLLCAACQVVFQNSQKFDQYGDGTEQKHHFEQDSFRDSIATGCYICSLLAQKIECSIQTRTLGGYEGQGLQPQFESVTYQIVHQDFEPYIYFTYYQREGNKYERILSLRLFNLSDVDAVLHENSITNSSFSKRNMELVRHWLQQCRKEHQKCQRIDADEKKLPTRLVEIQSIAGVDKIRLCCGANLSPSTSYLTLSHCWGRKPIFTLLNSNIELLSESIDKDRLPKVFQDAILMTRRLGFQHLWIDSLCIVQDSHEDWLREAPLMGEVYKNATCNLAATGFSDGRNGLFATRNGKLLSPLKVYVDWNGKSPLGDAQLRGQYYLLDGNLWEDNVSNAPLNRRAWVVQERILSPSIIHFGFKQLFWECGELKASEAFPNGFNYTIITGNDLKSDIDRAEFMKPYWQEVVQAYSKGRLTFSQDKLPALAGIAMSLWRTSHDRYIAGLWEGDLVHSLLWSVYNSSDFIMLPPDYRAPTWSWASIDAEISYLHASRSTDSSHGPADHPKEIMHSSAEAVNSTYLTGDPTIITVQWFLRIKGPLSRAWKYDRLLDLLPHFKNPFSLLRWKINLKKVSLNFFLDVPSYSDKTAKVSDSMPCNHSRREGPFVRNLDLCLLDRNVEHIFLLPIRSDFEDYSNFQVEMYGLVLYPTGRHRGEYQRIGLFVIEADEDRKVILESSDKLEEDYFEEMDESGLYTITIV